MGSVRRGSVLLARILWIQGYPDRAMNALEESIEEARRLQHPQSLCSAFAFGGCALALQTGDLDMAERLAAELVDIARRYAMEDFHAWGKAAQVSYCVAERAWEP